MHAKPCHLALLVVCVFLIPLMLGAQGPLTPATGPAPTMKTLEQIEPRTPISSAPFTINLPGSYYLTTNLFAPTGFTAAILIGTNDVRLDLNGFTLQWQPGSTAIGIYTTRSNITVMNGTFRGWAQSPIRLLAPHARVERINVFDCAGALDVGDNAVVSHCVVNNGTNNSAGIRTGTDAIVTDTRVDAGRIAGIIVGDRSRVARCRVSRSQGVGIQTGSRTVVTDCEIIGNIWEGIWAGSEAAVDRCVAIGNGNIGIRVDAGSTITHSQSVSNLMGIGSDAAATVLNCVVRNNWHNGIAFENAPGGIVRDCVIQSNGRHGIFAYQQAVIENNSVRDNGTNSTHAGIYIQFHSNIVADNHVFSNRGYGLSINGTNNLIIQNRAGRNGAGDFNFLVNNKAARVLTVTNNFVNTDPTANISF